jgi:hypothetical protein
MKSRVNILPTTYGEIRKFAHLNNITLSAAVVFFLLRFRDRYFNTIYTGRTTRYQPSQKDSHWISFHLSLSENDYEHLTDLRKFLKMSVSLMLALAVEEFASERLRDNYPPSPQINYTIDGYMNKIVERIVIKYQSLRKYDT